MKISYRTHPILEKLHSKDLGDISCYKCDEDVVKIELNSYRREWKRQSSLPHKIYYVTNTFIDAYELAADKLIKSNLWGDVENESICIILPSGQATYLSIKNSAGGHIDDAIITDFFDFYGNVLTGFSTHLITYGHLKPGESPERKSYHEEMKVYDFLGDSERTFKLGFSSKNQTDLEPHIFNCVLMTLFIKYAEVQIKNIPPKSKVTGINCKYVNDTISDIKILDSTWFTNLVKSDAFKVRGHFRLQPKKKDGEWTKELIWINDFQKEGYTRKAGKLQENDQA